MNEAATALAIEDWKRFTPLANKLPILFLDGTRLQHLSIECGGCSAHLEGECLRGEIREVSGDRYSIAGLAACQSCQAFTQFCLSSTGSAGSVHLEWQTAAGVLMSAGSVSWWRRLLSKFQ
ncbi:hypothetical protein [Pseudomonas abietaniphila]|uniref:hypothetical protein n=1 Tax=Pseudomonas abietaniphila TaxID=89065 RepID=UPI00094292E6|nr:hypothetical protein [Pseudomonas abietaniphila]